MELDRLLHEQTLQSNFFRPRWFSTSHLFGCYSKSINGYFCGWKVGRLELFLSISLNLVENNLPWNPKWPVKYVQWKKGEDGKRGPRHGWYSFLDLVYK